MPRPSTARPRITAAIADLTGEISQVPSRVSAIKVGGPARVRPRARRARRSSSRRAPSRCRGSRCVDLRRTDGFVDLDVVVDCSSGTYIRALARDLGAALGVGGHLTALRRTRIGPFGVDGAASIDDLGTTPLAYAGRRRAPLCWARLAVVGRRGPRPPPRQATRSARRRGSIGYRPPRSTPRARSSGSWSAAATT